MSLRKLKPSLLEILAVSALIVFAWSACNKPSGPDVKVVPAVAAPTPAVQVTPNKAKNITKLDLPKDRTVIIYGEINEGNDPTIQDILTLGKSSEPLYVVLKSPGGSVLEGAMIISAIEAAKGPVYTICDTLCASMAALIFEHGTGRYMVDRSFVMFHPASGGAEGEIDKMVSRMSTIQRFIGKMEAYVANRANITFERYKQLSGVELWIDSEDAVNNGFAVALVSYTYPQAFTSVPGANNKLSWKPSSFFIDPMERTLELNMEVK